MYTFVIGIPGTENIRGLLDSMAVAGGTDIDGKHYSVQNEEELVEALQSITTSLIPCIYELNHSVTTPISLQVHIDDDLILHDPNREDGWDLLGRTRLGFFGTSCNLLRDNQSHHIQAYLNCDLPQ